MQRITMKNVTGTAKAIARETGERVTIDDHNCRVGCNRIAYGST